MKAAVSKRMEAVCETIGHRGRSKAEVYTFYEFYVSCRTWVSGIHGAGW